MEEAKKLKPIPTMKNFTIGLPIPSERPVVDSSYTIVLSMAFKNQADADQYQIHPLHKSFTENVVRKLTQKVLIYDFQ